MQTCFDLPSPTDVILKMSETISLQVVLYTCLLACGLFRLAAGSDECHTDEFECMNGKCTDLNHVCDGDDNCDDNSDEKVCDPFQCHPSTSQCLNGKCIPRTWICNGYKDCEDNSDEQMCEPYHCHILAFQCSNGKCISRDPFCRGHDSCGDNSNNRYCNLRWKAACPQGWFQCSLYNPTCVPSQWVCDGYPDCNEGADEENCENVTRKIPDIYIVTTASYAAKIELKSYLLSKRKSGSRTNRWNSQVHRIAVALHLADNSTFVPGNRTGEEIRKELTLQLRYRLQRTKMSVQELAMYIHALLVSCRDPRDFYGSDLLRELRRKVEATGNYINPFLILVLCNAGDNMTAKDVERVTAAYDSIHRPLWTDSQAMSCMALSCIASHNKGLVDEHTLTEMLQNLKKQQFKNGTLGNFRTTALVSQALFIQDSYKKDFDLSSAVKVLVDGLNRSKSILNAYYALPVLHGKNLLHVSSSHCGELTVEEEDVMQRTLDVHGETIPVKYSVWTGDVRKTWRLRMLLNSTIYDAIETAAKIDNRRKIQYNVVDGKPYVASLDGKEDDPEMDMFWFLYLKALNSDDQPTFVEQSPVDINVTPNQEIILWYKRAPWNV